MNNNKQILFSEVQRFRQGWLWVLLITSSVVSIVLFTVTMIEEKKPLQEVLLFGSLIFFITLINIGAFYFVRFETYVTTQGINYRWWPFFQKFSTINWNDIGQAAVRNYPYFKIGYHRRKGFGNVHNVAGGKGVQLTLKNGNKIFIGSQKILAFHHSIEKSINKTVAMLQ